MKGFKIGKWAFIIFNVETEGSGVRNVAVKGEAYDDLAKEKNRLESRVQEVEWSNSDMLGFIESYIGTVHNPNVDADRLDRWRRCSRRAQ